jgi:hypothetical protein
LVESNRVNVLNTGMFMLFKFCCAVLCCSKHVNSLVNFYFYYSVSFFICVHGGRQCEKCEASLLPSLKRSKKGVHWWVDKGEKAKGGGGLVC